MPPYCEEHATYHSLNPGECQRMRAAARAEAKAAARRERAAQIAREVLALNLAEPGDAFKPDAALRHAKYTGGMVRQMLEAAALQALTETENAR